MIRCSMGASTLPIEECTRVAREDMEGFVVEVICIVRRSHSVALDGGLQCAYIE